MKNKRNAPCPCGSGKKYKKCCLERVKTQEVPSVPMPTGDYFRLKGEGAEAVVHELAARSFLTDWCFPNPSLPDGNELCDLLVVYDNTAIIWQIKDLKLDENGKYKVAEVETNLRQLSGAKRQLFDLGTPVELINSRRRTEKFDPALIKHLHLISVLLGEGEEVFSFVEEIKKSTAHVLTRDFTQIVLNELDTISDFASYLRLKEGLIQQGKGIAIVGGEEELLAYYLLNGRSFNELQKPDWVMFDGGSWADLQQRPEFHSKKDADRISYGWDSMINRAHEGGSLEYERIARELARPNRFERRFLAKAFADAHCRSHASPADHFRRVLPTNGVTYCFLFKDDAEPRGQRQLLLQTMCFIARGRYPQNTKVLGIATEKLIRPTCTYDFGLLDMPTWTEKDQHEMADLQAKTGIWTKPVMTQVLEDEYPPVTGDSSVH